VFNLFRFLDLNIVSVVCLSDQDAHNCSNRRLFTVRFAIHYDKACHVYSKRLEQIAPKPGSNVIRDMTRLIGVNVFQDHSRVRRPACENVVVNK
jgi:hypothetical protein